MNAEHPTDIPTINPLNPEFFHIFEELVRQLVGVFTTSEYLHVGGDEVNFRCWEEDPNLVSL
jgi:hypothetical protein